ncbi:protein-disulfide reductase DsbD [Rugamonas sp. CCM 8940]|uniref:protein-disulfide reductase DsbD n=1 Tax=Rugamonas sp. CCM 8940 TaxID=2765359 RepID=UPI0018F325CF|nr:protein-disulfide reductase DsbD [Rugamonas sp. CCM 8940]MBJ7310256.1 protein-disulfide reductase DsbD [Rugamonas sp. CCM 8940]
MFHPVRRAFSAPRLVALLSGFLLLLLLALGAARPALAEDEFLEPDAAFKFSARMVDGHTVAVTYQIAEGYYMYRERFKFAAIGAKLGAPEIPPGKVKFDETFQKKVETYRHSVTITMPVESGGPFTLQSTGQGCSDKGLCYAPQDAKASLVGSGMVPLPAAPASAAPVSAASAASAGASAGASAPAKGAAASTGVALAAAAAPLAPVSPGVTVNSVPMPQTTIIEAPVVAAAAAQAAPSAPSEMGTIEAALKGGRLMVYLPLFFLFGLGLSFTPCVLPMVPILSFIIVGEGTKVSRGRGLLLSSTYSLGMASVYTALGIAAGLAGAGLAATLQNPWVLGAFGLLMAALSLSMFGVYDLQVPASLQTRLSTISNRQSGGKLAGVFIMGAISALIVGPCVAAPLAGILVYIGKTGDVVVGGSALFAMAVGMSMPLLLVGVSAGSLLPRAGAWMDAVKRFFGVLLLAMAWWLVSPVLPPVVQMLGWTVLLVGYGGYLLARPGKWAGKVAGLLLAALGMLQLVGAASGGRDVLAPLAHLRAGGVAEALPFKRVKTVAELDAALARSGGKSAMLDFYADWCVSCKEMEKLTFVDPEVRARLANTILLQVDVTANDADDKAMLKRFGLYGPPGIILFDGKGREIADSRVIGFQNAEKFRASLEKLN